MHDDINSKSNRGLSSHIHTHTLERGGVDDIWHTKPSFPKRSTTPVELWDGWVFENGLIYDSDGRHYTQKDISLCFHAEQIVNGHLGKSQNIKVLKNELEKRKRLLKIPTVVLIFEDENGSEEHVFDLVKNMDE